MRQLIRYIALLTALLYSASALAVVDPYEVMMITPDQGEVDSLQHFTITFDGLPVEVNTTIAPTLQKGGGSTFVGRMSVAEDGTTVNVDFAETYTASGHYYLNLPEGSLTVNGQRLLPLTLRFTIAGDMDSFYEQITISPVEGEVESLQYFNISFPEYVGEITNGLKAILANTTTNKTYHGEMIGVGYGVIAYFPEEIAEAGKYTLTIPAGSVVFYTLGESVHELSFEYTIAGEEPSFYDQITIDPPEGDVEVLKDFVIGFPEPVEGIADGGMATLTHTATGVVRQAELTAEENRVTVDFGEEITEEGRYELTIPAGSIIVNSLAEGMRELNFNYMIVQQGMPGYTINPAEGELYSLQYFTIAYGQRVVVDEEIHPVLTKEDTGEMFECNLLEIGGNAVVYRDYPLSDVGGYTLTVPAGSIRIEATGQTNPEMAFHYVVVEREIYIPPVIEVQPAGDLHLYLRSGGLVREVEKEVSEGEEDLYEIVYERQEGALSIVFADSNKVYIQRPVSWTYYDGWVEGTLSEDGKTITVPMGQFVAYTRSLEMAVQVAMFAYDEEKGTYVYDPTVEELTYTINDDGSIVQNGTDQYLVLGTMNRAFGQNFQYLDYEWLQSGDYGSGYQPIDEVPMTPPGDMETDTYYLTTAINDGMDWEPYRKKVTVGFEGDNVWLQGISEFLPKAWIKGVSRGNKVTFSNPQLLGSNDVLFYFKCAEFNPVNGNTVQKDMVMTIDELGDMKTFDYIFITVDKDNLYYVNYYQGLTLSKYPDALLRAPEDMPVEEYEFSYTTQYSPTMPAVEDSHSVYVGTIDDKVYVRGLWPGLPQAWVMGKMSSGKVVFTLPQYMGDYKEEYSGTYPIYLSTYDKATGMILEQITFDYDPDTRAFSNGEMPLSIAINKTGYLSIQDYSKLAFTPVGSSVAEVNVDLNNGEVEYYDLQGRRLTDISNVTGIIIVKNADGTVTKMLKR